MLIVNSVSGRQCHAKYLVKKKKKKKKKERKKEKEKRGEWKLFKKLFKKYRRFVYYFMQLIHEYEQL